MAKSSPPWTPAAALFALLAAAPTTWAIQAPGIVHLPVTRSKASRPDTFHETLRRRSSKSSSQYSSVELQNLETIYSINITIGGQETSVALDTGSSELWVDPTCSAASRASNDTEPAGDTATDTDSDSDFSSPAYCQSIGRYDPSSSSTAAALGECTVFQYADSTTVELNYYTDTIVIGGLTITQQQFGVANVTNATSLGIMGMGPSPGYGYNITEQTYSYILDTLASQGQIASRAFSLDLRDYDNATGSIIFGGLDKKKFSGSLKALPLESVQMYSPSYNDGKTSYTEYGYYVTVHSLAITKPNTTTSSTYSQPSFKAVLDSGTTNILTPSGLSSKLCNDVGGKELTQDGSTFCLVDCSVRDLPGGLDVHFDGTMIRVTYQNLITEVVENGLPFCFLGASDTTVDTDPPTYILGDPFLRAAYAVFDWDNQQVHLAQAADCGSDVVAIGSGKKAVPTGGGCKESSSVRSAMLSGGRLLTVACVMSVVLLM